MSASSSMLAQPRVAQLPFSMACGPWILEAEGGEYITPRFAPEPMHVSANIMRRLRWLESRTGRTHVVCGLIPFDVQDRASLTITDQVRFGPRNRVPHPEVNETQSATHAQFCVPESPDYRTKVREALARIAMGSVEKVVLARTLEIALSTGVEPERLCVELAERLGAANPAADIYVAPDAEGGTWVGASPEIVSDVSRGRFLTHPLAGSLAKDMAREQAEARLLGSAKDRHEHAHVVRHIEEVLRALTTSHHIPQRPSLFATDTMWHLGTPITAQLRPGVSALDVALALHPTPAVCGTPAEAAASLITELEPTPRGAYAGLVGWCDSSGDGRWSLVLRGARVTNDQLRLYAGAGIVTGSDPEAEHAETAAKFATVLRCVEGLT